MQNLLIIGESLIENHKNQAEAGSLYSEVGVFDNRMRKTLDSINKEAFFGRAFCFMVMIAIRTFTSSLHHHFLVASAFGALSVAADCSSHGHGFGILLLEPTQSFEASSPALQLDQILFQLEGFIAAFSGNKRKL